MIILYGVNLLLAAAAGLLLLTRNSLAAHVIIVLGVVIVFASWFLGYFRYQEGGRGLLRRWKEAQRLKYLDFRIRWLLSVFENEKTVRERWKRVGELFEEWGVIRARLVILPTEETFLWIPTEVQANCGATAVITLSLTGEEGMRGRLEIEWGSRDGLFPLGISRMLNLMQEDFWKDVKR